MISKRDLSLNVIPDTLSLIRIIPTGIAYTSVITKSDYPRQIRYHINSIYTSPSQSAKWSYLVGSQEIIDLAKDACNNYIYSDTTLDDSGNVIDLSVTRYGWITRISTQGMVDPYYAMSSASSNKFGHYLDSTPETEYQDIYVDD